MNKQIVKITDTPIVLSRGIFDLLKEQLRTRKLSRYNELKLALELKNAVQVLRSELPSNIVAINTSVKVEHIKSGEIFVHNLVAPNKARRKNNTISILSPIGVAIMGYGIGATIQWEMDNGSLQVFKILDVKPLNRSFNVNKYELVY